MTFHGYLHSLARRTREAREEQGWKDSGTKEGALAPPGRITQLRSFPSELFLQFYARLREGGGGLAPLPVILLRNSDNAAAAMNNGGITRRKSANVFFRPRQLELSNLRIARCLTFRRYQTQHGLMR